MIDRLLGLLLFVLFLPLMFLIAAISFVCFGRRFIFTSTRLGYLGRPFKIFKYTSMEHWSQERFDAYLEQHADCKRQWLQKHKLYNDPRCCAWGNFLRRFSLDELPQLLNVIRGEMALVGPRPIIQEEVSLYGCRAESLFSVKPGMTGLWQVSGRNLTTYRRRVAMDVYYAKHKCARLDVWILYRTIWAVLGGKGAF